MAALDVLGIASNSGWRKCLDAESKRAPPEPDAPDAGVAEEVVFSDTVIKVNRKGKRQKRSLVITNVAAYNFEPKKYKKYKRRIRLVKLSRIFVLGADEFVLHSTDEYDYRLASPRRDEIIAQLQAGFQALTGAPLASVEMDQRHVETLMVSKGQMKRRQGSVDARPSSARLSVPAAAAEAGAGAGAAAGGSPEPAAAAAAAAIPEQQPELEEADDEDDEDDQPAADEDDDDQDEDEDHGLMQMFGILSEIKTKSDNSRVREVCRWAHTTPLEVVRVIAEILFDSEAAQDVVWWFATVPRWASTFLAGLEGAITSRDADVRYWAIKSLWRLLQLYEAENLCCDEVKAGGFPAYVREDLVQVGLDVDMYHALLEILLDLVQKPSDNSTSAVEAFGKVIANPELLQPLFRLAYQSRGDDLVRELLKDVNVLLLRREENHACFLEQEGWQLWVLPLLERLPRAAADRSEAQEEMYKFVLNTFAMLHLHVFKHGKLGDITVKSIMRASLDSLRQHSGWANEQIAVGRTLLASMLSKIGGGLSRWKHNMEAKEWESIFKLTTVVQEFLFNYPADDASPPAPATRPKMMLYACARPGGPGLAPRDPDVVGIHLDPIKCTCDDTSLAKRVLDILKKLGIQPEAPGARRSRLSLVKGAAAGAAGGGGGADGGGSSQGRDVKKRGRETASAFRDYMTLFQSVDSGDEAETAAVMTKVAQFLDRRKRVGVGMGFFTRKPQSIVSQLKQSMIRQQAESLVAAHEMQQAAQSVVIDDADLEAAAGEEGEAEPEVHTVRHATFKTAALAAVATSSGSSGSSAAAAAAAAPEQPAAEAAAPAAEAAAAAAPEAAAQPAADAQPEEEKQQQAGPPRGAAEGLPAELQQDASQAGDTQLVMADLTNLETAEPEEDEISTECGDCGEEVDAEQGLLALKTWWHPAHFKCSECSVAFKDIDFEYFERRGAGFCRRCYLRLFGRCVCASCLVPLKKGQEVFSAVNLRFHKACFVCSGACGRLMQMDEPFYTRNSKPYCAVDYAAQYLTCPNCHQEVREDEDGKAALGRVWHQRCLVCMSGSGCELPDGAFFAMDSNDGRGELPYCEAHFTELFVPKCKVCREPVTHDGVSAAGASYHSACLRCSGADQCGVMAFPDGAFHEHEGEPWCDDCYYERFGSRCAKCREVVRGSVLQANDRSWHPSGCFGCAGGCGTLFEDLSYYTGADEAAEAFCEACYTQRFCERCAGCGEYVTEGDLVQALGAAYHRDHLRCVTCDKVVGSGGEEVFSGPDNQPMCREDYLAQCAARCAVCTEPITGAPIASGGRSYCASCFLCTVCSRALDPSEKFYLKGEDLVCGGCFESNMASRCAGCAAAILPEEEAGCSKVGDKMYHPACLKCKTCDKAFGVGESICQHEGELLCRECYVRAVAKPCTGCGEPITAQYLTVLGRQYHSQECITCFACAAAFVDGQIFQVGTWPACATCAQTPVEELSEVGRKRLAEEEGGGEAAAAAPAPAPAPAAAPDTGGWKAVTEGESRYFWNEATGATQYDCPPELKSPSGWERVDDEAAGTTYWWKSDTNETSQTPPEDWPWPV